MPGRNNRVCLLYTVLNSLTALWWLSSSARRLMGLSAMSWGCILLVGVAIWRWRRTVAPPVSRLVRLYVTVSKIALTLSWLLIGAMMALWVVVTEPWPLSLRHGPDTPYACEVFVTYVPGMPPTSVTGLYAQRAWAGFGEHLTFMTFQFHDAAIIRLLITRLSLEAVAPDEIQTLQILDGPAWWPGAEVLARLPEVYRYQDSASAQVFRYLWIDRVQRRVYFQEADFA